MTQEEFILQCDDETLRKYVEHGKGFLIEHPEPPALKGRSRVRKWIEFAALELKRRFPDD